MNAAVDAMSLTREVRDLQLPRLAVASEAPLPAAYWTLIYAEAYAFS